MSGEQEGLPEGWSRTTLTDVGWLVTGTTPPRKRPEFYGGSIPFVKPGDLDGEQPLLRAGETVTVEGAASGRLLPVGSVLVSCIGNLGKTALLGVEAISNQQINAVVPGSGIEPLYLFHWCQTLRPWMEANASATTVSILNKGRFSGAPFLLPPENEQRRIVAKIESLQARSEAAKEALDAIPPLLEKFRQSVLAAAFRGDLTASWRAKNPDVEPASVLLERIRAERRTRWIADAAEKGRARAEARARKAGKPWTAADDAKVLDKERVKAAKKYKAPPPPDVTNGTPTLPPTWELVSVADLTECLDRIRKPVTRKDRRPGPYPYYGANGQVDSVDQYLFDEDLVLVTEDETFYGRTKPIAYRVSGKCWVNNHAHVLRAIPPVPTDFICQSLMHYNVIPWLSGTTGRAKLTQGAMNILPIALAPEAEMSVIARKVSELLDFADSIASKVAELQVPQASLNQSILAKAFRGELVPQDPTDEPASVLLERIRAEREAAEAAKKAAKKKRGRKGR